MENCKKYGANVIIHGENIGESRTHALKIAAKRGFMYVNGYDHPNILAGQGTMGLEILDQVSGNFRGVFNAFLLTPATARCRMWTPS